MLAVGISSFLKLLLPGAADVHFGIVITVGVPQGLVGICSKMLVPL